MAKPSIPRRPADGGKPGAGPGGPLEDLILDDRERPSGLAGELERVLGRPPRVRRLEVGDVLVRGRILIERKTAADFEASLIDGRLFEQAPALARANFDPLIIVEGTFDRAKNRASGAALRQALLALVMDFRLPVVRSAGLADTAQWVKALLEGRRRAEPPDWRGVTPAGARRPEAERPGEPRRAPLSPALRARRQTEALLAAIEGVGPVRARALAEAFGSLGALMAADHDAIARVSGVGTRMAARIRLALEGKTEG